jgi:hypothetical protein
VSKPAGALLCNPAWKPCANWSIEFCRVSPKFAVANASQESAGKDEIRSLGPLEPSAVGADPPIAKVLSVAVPQASIGPSPSCLSCSSNWLS